MNKLWFEKKGEKGKPKSQGGSTFNLEYFLSHILLLV